MSPHSTTSGHRSPPVKNIPLAYSSTNSDRTANELVLALFPEWDQGEGEIEYTRFKDGITNTLMKVVKRRPGQTQEQLDDEAILLRAYGNGTEVLIDRERETTSHTILALHGLAPQLLARFKNGLLYRFIPGRVCTPQDLTTEPIWRGVAYRLGQWHAQLPIISQGKTAAVNNEVQIPLVDPNTKSAEALARIFTITQQPVPNIWSVMQKWVLALSNDTKEERQKNATLQKELERSAAELSSTPGLGGNGLIFGHCDLLSANVIVTSSERDTPDRSIESVSFIDYEYATPSPAAFDLANHFSEWGGFECDYNALPARSTRRAFLQQYMSSYAADVDLDPSIDYVSRLFDEVDRFRGIPGLYWGIWALIQAKISQINFDYASYADVRLKEYWNWRAESDGTRAKETKDRPLRERRWAEE